MNMFKTLHHCLLLLVLLPTDSNSMYCTIASSTGRPECYVANTTTIADPPPTAPLVPKALRTLATTLYNLRKKTRTRTELEHTPHLTTAVARTFNTSCLPDANTPTMAGVCAELSLQLCALNREAHRYHSAVAACKHGVRLANIASMKQTRAWKHGDEYAALRMRGKAALARAYGDVFQYEKALDVMADIHKTFGADVPNAARFVLMDLHSEILLCAGDVHMSLVMYERAFGQSQTQRSTTNLRRHIELLDASFNARPPPPVDVRRAMNERKQATITQLLQVGSWNNKDQLPLHYVPDLMEYGPYPQWKDMSTDIQRIKDIVERKEMVDALQKEVQTLMESSSERLERDRECIHGKVTRSRNKGGGHWYRYSPTGYWHGNLIEGCTASVTPVACALYAQLKQELQAKDTLVRIGYSIVKHNTWIRPHYGRTNAQLKLHLGLVVPGASGGVYKCPPEIRVGRTDDEGKNVRTWEQGKVLLFDDSYEHEVYNGCDTDRAVLQLVVQRN